MVNAHNRSLDANATHVVANLDGRRRLTIEPGDLDRLRQPTRWLNNICLNGVARALLDLYRDPTTSTSAHAARCAVLSTLDLHQVQYNTSDAVMWHHLSPTKYWEKPIWLVPIHRRAQSHWVLAVVSVPDTTLYFFDSFSDRERWDADLKVIR